MFCPYTYFTNNTIFGVFTPTEHTYVLFHLLVFCIIASIYSLVMMCITSFNNNIDNDYEVLSLSDSSDDEVYESDMDRSNDEYDMDTSDNELQKTIKNLERDIRNYRCNAKKDTSEISSLQTENANYRKTINCQQEKITNMTSEIGTLVKSNMAYSTRILKLEQELEQLRGLNVTFTNEKVCLQSMNQSLQSEILTLRHKLDNISTNTSIMERDMRNLRRNNNKLEHQNAELEEQLEVANISISNMTDQIDDLQEQNSLLQEKLNDLDNDRFNDSKYDVLLDALELMTKQQLINITSKSDREKILPGDNSKRKLKYTALYNHWRCHFLMPFTIEKTNFTVSTKQFLNNNKDKAMEQYLRLNKVFHHI